MPATPPPGARLLTADEAVEVIQERKHVTGVTMSFEHEQQLIAAPRDGIVIAAILADGQIAFTKEA